MRYSLAAQYGARYCAIAPTIRDSAVYLADGFVHPVRLGHQRVHRVGHETAVSIEHFSRPQSSGGAHTFGEKARILAWESKAHLHAQKQVCGKKNFSLGVPDDVMVRRMSRREDEPETRVG